ncbi:hypothetical protein PG994_009620 [Apiospora phragmitis]|uniref:F-box domain-containing protein n=1 Tax=Apiospora phragmitis TaxID=2905665 RepID=A0ABR1U6L7_9PEZI
MSKCPLDRLPDEILQHILDLAMVRDSTFYIDNPYPKKQYLVGPGHKYPVLKAADGSRDERCTPLHPFSLRPDHQRDWLAANSVSQRLRRLGRPAFFRAKVIAMESSRFLGVPGESLSRTALAGAYMPIQGPPDRAAALACLRHIVLVDAPSAAPMWYLRLPALLGPAHCPQLRRVTLLFGFRPSGDDPEWVTAACVLAAPVPAEMREQLVAGAGMSPKVAFEEAVGIHTSWGRLRVDMEKAVYPILEMKAKARLAKKEERVPS